MYVRSKKLIYLTGFMGSGKSTVAPVLATALNWSCIDTDEEIEKREQKTIREIFRENGEQYFRAREREVLSAVSLEQERVVALGGGAITIDENIQTVQSTGVLVYLKADAEDIFQRLDSVSDRPLLESIDGKKIDGDELRIRIGKLLEVREPFYKQADIIVEIKGKHVQAIVEEILGKLTKILNSNQ